MHGTLLALWDLTVMGSVEPEETSRQISPDHMVLSPGGLPLGLSKDSYKSQGLYTAGEIVIKHKSNKHKYKFTPTGNIIND
jgi:hypothetical protein